MILVTGAAGQLGVDVIRELVKRNIKHVGTDIVDMDITDAESVNTCVQLHKPQSVIHCAAYTGVDKAEDEPDICYKVNAKGTENIAQACRNIDAEMIYISTDYVFDGESSNQYETNDVKNPLSVYGKSKLAGEEAVIRHIDKYYIVRTSWVFGAHGNNFVKTMLKISQDREELNVVGDQVGSPTYTLDLAKLLCDMAMSGKYGTYHVTNEGFCSWAEFAEEIMRLTESCCKINSIPSEQYITRAIRPKNSRLSKKSLDREGFTRLQIWESALRIYIRKLTKRSNIYDGICRNINEDAYPKEESFDSVMDKINS